MRILLTILAVLALANVAGAAGTLGVYFDAGYSQNELQVNPLEAFNIYVILHNVDSGVSGVEYKLNLPSDVVITGTTYAGENPLAIDNAALGTSLGFGSCELALAVLDHDWVIVAEFSAITLNEFSTSAISLNPYVNPQDPVSAPRWADCQSGQNTQLYEVDTVENASMMSSTVGVDSASWGSVKSLFNN